MNIKVIYKIVHIYTYTYIFQLLLNYLYLLLLYYNFYVICFVFTKSKSHENIISTIAYILQTNCIQKTYITNNIFALHMCVRVWCMQQIFVQNANKGKQQKSKINAYKSEKNIKATCVKLELSLSDYTMPVHERNNLKMRISRFDVSRRAATSSFWL